MLASRLAARFRSNPRASRQKSEGLNDFARAPIHRSEVLIVREQLSQKIRQTFALVHFGERIVINDALPILSIGRTWTINDVASLDIDRPSGDSR